MQTVEHELEVTVRVHEVRSEYERQIEEWVHAYDFYIRKLVEQYATLNSNFKAL